MAGRGAAPSGKRSRKRDEPVLTEYVETGKLHGPDLPQGVLPNGQNWHPQTIKFWDALRRSPLTEHEDDLSWSWLLDTALMHNEMWAKGRWDFAAELRLRTAKYGATPEDKMRLRVKVVVPDDEPEPTVDDEEAGVVDITSRRKRLLSE
jgi:hypothetical protein